MRDKNRNLKIFTCAFCILIIAICIPLLIIAVTTSYPASLKDTFKPMYLPIFLLGFLTLTALFFLISTGLQLLRDSKAARADGETPEKFVPITSSGVFAFIATILYALAWQYIGFTISTAIFFALASKRFEPERPWKQVVPVSILFAVVVYVVFVIVFNVPFPEPILNGIL